MKEKFKFFVEISLKSPNLKLEKSLELSADPFSKIEISQIEQSEPKLELQFIYEADKSPASDEISTLQSYSKEFSERYADIISLNYDTEILDVKYKGYQRTDGSGKLHTAVMVESLSLGYAIGHVNVLVNGETVEEQLKRYLTQDAFPVINRLTREDALRRYRLAIGHRDSLSKYIELYKILDVSFSSDTKQLDEWIYGRLPTTTMHPADRNHKHDYSEFTYLRDAIAHPKLKSITPISEINKALPKLKDLVRQRIFELWPNK